MGRIVGVDDRTRGVAGARNAWVSHAKLAVVVVESSSVDAMPMAFVFVASMPTSERQCHPRRHAAAQRTARPSAAGLAASIRRQRCSIKPAIGSPMAVVPARRVASPTASALTTDMATVRCAAEPRSA
jgi:hypothetical protein